MPDLVSLDAIHDAARRLHGVIRQSPLLDARPLTDSARRAATPLFLKCENLQVGGAFKIRGAYNMALQIPLEARRGGLITYSSGNHGLAVALTSRLLGTTAVVVMPTTAPTVKVEGVRALGAEVVFEGTTTVQRKARAEAEAAGRGLAIVPPFEHDEIIAGQGTVGLEIAEQCTDVGTVYVPVSGGGLLAGVGAAIKRLKPGAAVVAVEPAGAARMTASLAAGRPVTIEIVPGIADGLLAVRPGEITFRHLQAFVDRVMVVEDRAIVSAIGWLFREAKVVAEPSGAITVAAALADAAEGRGRGPRVAVISGGNVEPEAFVRYLIPPDPAPR